jgi:hypothetical protein
MSNAKALPIATAVAGLLAAIGITIKLATTSTKPPIPLEDRVDELLAHEKELVESDPFENLTFRIQEFSEVADESRNLPRAKQLQVAKCLRALRALENYPAFEKQINEIPDPKTAQSRTQLTGIDFRLRQVQLPGGLPDVVTHGGAILRWKEWLEDAGAMEVAYQQLATDYMKLIDEAKKVLMNKNEPNLPDRIQKVLSSAKDLKTPQNKDTFLPGSERVTYAMVFRLTEIDKLVRDWIVLKEQLEPALKSKSQ